MNQMQKFIAIIALLLIHSAIISQDKDSLKFKIGREHV